MMIGSLVLVVGAVWTISSGEPLDVGVGIVGVALFGMGFIAAALGIECDWAAQPRNGIVGNWAAQPRKGEFVDQSVPEVWFEVEPEEEFDEDELALIGALAAYAVTWPTEGVSSSAFRANDPAVLVACARFTGLDFGVHIDGDTVRGDRLHNQLYTLPNEPSTLSMTAIGPRENLLAATAAWFEAILRRPVERLEWWHNGWPYAARLQFADTGEGLREAYARNLAPDGQYKRLIKAGSFRGRDWIKTAGIGPADRVVPVRVDGEEKATPPLPDFLWYECPLELP
jgi:hypothetical protein